MLLKSVLTEYTIPSLEAHLDATDPLTGSPATSQ